MSTYGLFSVFCDKLMVSLIPLCVSIRLLTLRLQNSSSAEEIFKTMLETKRYLFGEDMERSGKTVICINMECCSRQREFAVNAGMAMVLFNMEEQCHIDVCFNCIN